MALTSLSDIIFLFFEFSLGVVQVPEKEGCDNT
jgi:hypothetical protein